MNITLEKTGDLTAQIHVQVESADYKPQVKAELKKYAKDLKIPGFRPGKVPVGMVRKMAGIGLVIDEVQKVVNEKLNAYFQEENLNILGDPLPTETKDESDFDINCEQSLMFDFDLGIAPELDIDFQFEGAPTKYEIEIDDAYLEEEITKLLERFSDVSQPDTIEEGDMIFGRLVEVNAEGEAVEDGFDSTISLNPARIENKELFEPFFGKGVDDTLALDLFAIADTDEEIAALTFIDKEDLADLRDKPFQFTVKRLNRTVLGTMNEDFFDKVAQNFGWEEKGEDEVWDEASFRERFREAHAEEMKSVESQRFHEDMHKAMLDNMADLEFPEEFLKKWLGAMDEKKTEEDIEKEFSDFKRSLTWSLVVEKLQKENEDLLVTPEEVTESIQAFVRQNLAYSGQGLSQEQESQYMMHMLQNKEYINQTYSRLSSDKIFPFIEEKAEPARVATTATDFFKLVEEEKAAAEEEEAKRIAEEAAAAVSEGEAEVQETAE